MQLGFLDAKATRREMRSLIATSRSASIAIAYWGEDALQALGLEKREGNVRVLCDLLSGACNPDEIKKLLAIAKVRTLSKLHAKLACFDDAVVVGSSNASASGLGFEGKETRHNIEAGVLVREAAVVKAAQDWFDQLWQRDDAKDVDAALAESVKPLWDSHRSNRHVQRLETVLDGLQANHVRVALYKPDGVMPETIKKYETEVQATFTARSLEVYSLEDPYYEDVADWDVTPGTVIIDFQIMRRNGVPQFGGIWQVRDEPLCFVPVPTDEFPDARMVVCEPLLDIDGYRFPEAEQKLVARRLKDWMAGRSMEHKEHGFLLDMSLAEFRKKVLRT